MTYGASMQEMIVTAACGRSQSTFEVVRPVGIPARLLELWTEEARFLIRNFSRSRAARRIDWGTRNFRAVTGDTSAAINSMTKDYTQPRGQFSSLF
jgi:hypothetical protein